MSLLTFSSSVGALCFYSPSFRHSPLKSAGSRSAFLKTSMPRRISLVGRASPPVSVSRLSCSGASLASSAEAVVPHFAAPAVAAGDRACLSAVARSVQCAAPDVDRWRAADRRRWVSGRWRSVPQKPASL